MSGTVVCRRCGGEARWLQRKDQSWYLAVPAPQGDGDLPGRYWAKVGRRPHACAETHARRARTLEEAEARRARIAATLRALEGLPPASLVGIPFDEWRDEDAMLAVRVARLRAEQAAYPAAT